MVSAVIVVGVSLPLADVAGADTSADDTVARRDEVRRRQAQADRSADLARADADRLQRELDSLTGRITVERDRVGAAEADAAAAVKAARVAARRLEVAERRLQASQLRLEQAIIDAYTAPAIDPALMSLAVPIDEAGVAEAMLGARADEQLRVTREVAEHRAEVARNRRAADQQRREAEDAAKAARAALDELIASEDRQRRVLGELDRRIAERLAESAALARLDRELSDTIAAEERRRAEAAARARAEVVAAEQAQEKATQGKATPGNAQAPKAPKAKEPSTATPPAPKPPSGASAPVSGTVTWADVRRVTGTSIWVHKSIVGNVQALVDAARADGVVLNGGGFRDPEFQIELRKAHCGTDPYSIYDKPASQCTPPTAPPGMSLHERGLAVDFTYNGSIIATRSSPAYQWLVSNAAKYGLFNLPSEPWHWSTNGR